MTSIITKGFESNNEVAKISKHMRDQMTRFFFINSFHYYDFIPNAVNNLIFLRISYSLPKIRTLRGR